MVFFTRFIPGDSEGSLSGRLWSESRCFLLEKHSDAKHKSFTVC